MKRRNLNLDKLMESVQWEDMQRFLKRLTPEAPADYWPYVNADALRTFLDQPENSDAAGVIEEHLRRINDVCWNDGSILIEVANYRAISYDQELPSYTFALRLFLDHPEAFDFAWSMYLRIALAATICEFRFPAGSLRPTKAQVKSLQDNLGGWFANMKRGGQCFVACFEEGEGLLVRVTRGDRIKTIARWRGLHTEIDSFRPAQEDVVWYDPVEARLRMRVSRKLDREFYLQRIAEVFAGSAGLADAALKEPVYSLEPFQKGDFDYGGDGVLSHLTLIEVDLRLRGLTVPTLTLRSADVNMTLRDEMPSIKLASGELTRVKLRAEILAQFERKPREVVFEIKPPGFSDIGEKTYKLVLEQYLRRQRVKLN